MLGGGGGVDTFFFSSDQCLIRDFDPATEIIYLNPDFGVDAFEDLDEFVTSDPGDVVFSFSAAAPGYPAAPGRAVLEGHRRAIPRCRSCRHARGW